MLLTSTLTAIAASVPVFDHDYYSGQFNQLSLNQGGIDTADGSCCAPTAAQCKIQEIAEGGDMYVDHSHNRTRNDSPQGIVANLYLLKKQMALQPVGDGSFQCAQYCPLTDEQTDLAIKSDALHLGKHKITQGGEGGKTKDVDLYYYTDRLIIIPMDHVDFYVDESVNPPAPFYVSTHITPFGMAQIAVENTSYLQYVPGTPDPSKFNITGIKECPKSDNCNDNNNGLGSLRSIWNRFTPTYLQQAKRIAASAVKKIDMLHTKKALNSNDGNLTFPGDYTAKETSLLLINQGGEEDANGNFCCNRSHLGQCQVQYQSLNGAHYVDLTNQRSRFEDVVSGITVNDYKKHMSMEVVHNETTGKDTCVKFCPLDPEETLERFGIDPDAKDKGSTTINGQSVEQYEWSDVILKIIKMSTTDFYADVSNSSMAIPVFQTERLTPFGGAQIGSENHTWADVTPQPIDPAKFDIAGVNSCPQDPQCQQSGWQAKRIFFRQRLTWASYEKDL
jgi:hypothetical protein